MIKALEFYSLIVLYGMIANGLAWCWEDNVVGFDDDGKIYKKIRMWCVLMALFLIFWIHQAILML